MRTLQSGDLWGLVHSGTPQVRMRAAISLGMGVIILWAPWSNPPSSVQSKVIEWRLGLGKKKRVEKFEEFYRLVVSLRESSSSFDSGCCLALIWRGLQPLFQLFCYCLGNKWSHIWGIIIIIVWAWQYSKFDCYLGSAGSYFKGCLLSMQRILKCMEIHSDYKRGSFWTTRLYCLAAGI